MKSEWEVIENSNRFRSTYTERMRIPGGWLYVKADAVRHDVPDQMVFVPVREAKDDIWFQEYSERYGI